MTDRYSKNPFLRLVDCYVLDAIGELPTEQELVLKQLEPRLRKSLHAEGQWREIVESKMEFRPEVKEHLRRFWTGYRSAAKQQNVEVTGYDFVVDFVNQNFPFLLEDE